jgi:YHS domain-containing protein
MKTKLICRRFLPMLVLLLLAVLMSGPTVRAEKPKPYPLKVCLVTDNDLDSMGGPVTKVYQGQELKFCCKPCVKKFDANPAKYLPKLK